MSPYVGTNGPCRILHPALFHRLDRLADAEEEPERRWCCRRCRPTSDTSSSHASPQMESCCATSIRSLPTSSILRITFFSIFTNCESFFARSGPKAPAVDRRNVCPGFYTGVRQCNFQANFQENALALVEFRATAILPS